MRVVKAWLTLTFAVLSQGNWILKVNCLQQAAGGTGGGGGVSSTYDFIYKEKHIGS